jgi:aspartyl-tRNA(Asn)/glutamyl-tRNA(Gln) amidotransferase subunit B
MQTSADDAIEAVRLVMLANDVSLRNLIPNELAKGFGFFQSKPASEMTIEQAPVSAAQLAAVITRIQDGTINNNAAKQIFDLLWAAGRILGEPLGAGYVERAISEIDEIIEAKGLKQMNDTGELEKIIDDVLAANPKNVEEFKAGNTKALNGLVGPIMKASKGKANPGQVNALLMKKLGG